MMSKTLMLSSLIAGLLTLGMASVKTMEIVQESRCKTFAERCAAVQSVTGVSADGDWAKP